MNVIDLRSDTVTRPSAAMREAMARAEVGDDVYGEDPTVNRLQERVAALLGKEAGLFVPSGTMANQIAIGVLARAGEEVICDQGAHIVNFEGGAMAALWGVQPRTLVCERGILDVAQVAAAIRPANDHLPRTRVIEIENTHNRGGGAVYPLARVEALAALARERDLHVYLDGARLANAAVASDIPMDRLAAGATLASICLSKGLGAPAGSVLCGSRAAMAEARRLRKRLGGGMRQAGVLAAAGLFALEHNFARLAEDHANAQRLARGLLGIPGVRLLHPQDTNLVFAAFDGRDLSALVTSLRERGVLCNPEGAPGVLRFVTHLDVSAAQIDDALGHIASACN
jgi:threonine aldolase